MVALEGLEERAHKNAKELLAMNDKEFREWVIKGLQKRIRRNELGRRSL